MKLDTIYCGDVLGVLRTWPDAFVHCVVTSIPYWGLRDYGLAPLTWYDGWVGSFGLEPTIEMYVDHAVTIFRELRRIMRDDSVLWLNCGDSYAGGGNNRGNLSPISDKQASNTGATGQCAEHAKNATPRSIGLKPLDLCGVPWRLAVALQADGWWLRSATVWAKGLSFCPTYSGSVMPESVNGWRYEQHRVKVKKSERSQEPKKNSGDQRPFPNFHDGGGLAQWRDCPGCPKCEKNDGLILRKGSWRPTSAYEMVFMLTKSATYFCDGEAVKENKAESTVADPRTNENGHRRDRQYPGSASVGGTNLGGPTGSRNPRNVWAINPQAFPAAHFATYPEALVEPCIKAGTSEKGCCPECGAPWVMVITNTISGRKEPDGIDRGTDKRGVRIRCGEATKNTLGWRPSCECYPADDVAVGPINMAIEPCIVLDPFMGSGTTALVAWKLHRRWLGIELSPEYIKLANKRLDAARNKLALFEGKI